METKARPVLKWVGGKRQLLGNLTSGLPAFGSYYELFAGGAALFFELSGRAVSYSLNDANPDLAALYRDLRDDIRGVMGVHAQLVNDYMEYKLGPERDAFYYENREAWNIYRGAEHSVTRSARLLFLNKACHGGVFRVNKNGFFNVPVGKGYNPPSFATDDVLLAAHCALQGVDIHNCSFQDFAWDRIPAGSLVYLDPPYIQCGESDFTAYTTDGFSDADQRGLAQHAYNLASRGVHVMLSNADDPLVDLLYPGWGIERITARRSVNVDVSKRGNGAGEVIIRSWRNS